MVMFTIFCLASQSACQYEYDMKQEPLSVKFIPLLYCLTAQHMDIQNLQFIS